MIYSNLKQNPDLGILLLQKFKNSGVKSIFHNCLFHYIKAINQDLSISVNPILSTNLLEKMEKAEKISALRFIKREVPKECADKVMLDKHTELYEERVFRYKRGKKGVDGSLKFLKSKMEEVIKDLKLVTYPYVEIENETYDEVKIELSKKGGKTTLTLSEQSEFREHFIIDEKDIILNGGHPTEDSMSRKGIEYLNIILDNHDEDTVSLSKDE